MTECQSAGQDERRRHEPVEEYLVTETPVREFDGFGKAGRDAAIEDQLVEHCRRFGIGPLDAIKLFAVLTRRQWMKRFLAHAELFRQTLEVPGDIAEVGVFRGAGLMTWANLLEAYCIGDRTKVVVGFDNWEGFSALAPEDGAEVESLQKKVGGFSPARYLEELTSAIDIYDQDRFVQWKPRIQLIRGNIEETAPRFVRENPGVRFSLVHLDCDLYRPTAAALRAFWPRLSRGGLLLLDEYAIREWPGETRALDELLEELPGVRVKTLSWTNTPAGIVVKS
jgi:hypothetical protein